MKIYKLAQSAATGMTGMTTQQAYSIDNEKKTALPKEKAAGLLRQIAYLFPGLKQFLTGGQARKEYFQQMVEALSQNSGQIQSLKTYLSQYKALVVNHALNEAEVISEAQNPSAKSTEAEGTRATVTSAPHASIGGIAPISSM